MISLFNTSSQADTTYQFEIVTPERIMSVFGTVMSHSGDGVLIDLWCPDEPRFSQRSIISNSGIREGIETLIKYTMEKLFFSEDSYTIKLISN